MISHPVCPAAPSHIERTFLRFLNEIVDRGYISVTPLEDFFLYTLGESRYASIHLNGFITRKSRCETSQRPDARGSAWRCQAAAVIHPAARGVECIF